MEYLDEPEWVDAWSGQSGPVDAMVGAAWGKGERDRMLAMASQVDAHLGPPRACTVPPSHPAPASPPRAATARPRLAPLPPCPAAYVIDLRERA